MPNGLVSPYKLAQLHQSDSPSDPALAVPPVRLCSVLLPRMHIERSYDGASASGDTACVV